MTLTYHKDAWRATVQNGDIPRHMLREVYPTQFDRDLGGPAIMHPEAAAAMSTMLQAAAEQGFGDLAVSLSYRTLAKQQEKWADFQAGGNLAAVPGTSNHGWAVAADMRWGRAVTLAWLQTHARRYGFVNDVPTENWHYTFQEGLWNGDDVTEEQLEKLNASFAASKQTVAILAGMANFVAGDAAPDDALPAQKRTVAVLEKAARLPRPGTPGPHEHNLQGKAV